MDNLNLKPTRHTVEAGDYLAASPADQVEEARDAEFRMLRAIAEEYGNCIRHMDAGGDFYEFQRAAMSASKENSNG